MPGGVCRGAEHAGRWQRPGGRLQLFGGAEGRHRDRAVFSGLPLDPLTGIVKGCCDAPKLDYVGSVKAGVYVCCPRRDAPAKAFKDGLTHAAIVGAASFAACAAAGVPAPDKLEARHSAAAARSIERLQ